MRPVLPPSGECRWFFRWLYIRRVRIGYRGPSAASVRYPSRKSKSR